MPGEAENRIGELFADRASTATMPGNQLRMWFSAMAYVLLDSLRRIWSASQPVRRCRRRDRPSQAVEAWRSGPHQRPPHSPRSRIELPEQNRIRAARLGSDRVVSAGQTLSPGRRCQ
jgi:hypothetical protein